MFGNPIGSNVIGSLGFISSDVIRDEPGNPVPTVQIDATKVPSYRTVVFEGSRRVVSFPGSINKVRF